MNMVDGAVLGLLAVADIAMLVHIRRARARRIRDERMMRSLKLAVHRSLNNDEIIPAADPWALRRAG
ncbi:MAG TPA: hypothetical protein VKU19_38895 [Bryobacteraceae bacterium]|nr:hypothetical protein [Bryobacteraceae bacterium]